MRNLINSVVRNMITESHLILLESLLQFLVHQSKNHFLFSESCKLLFVIFLAF